MSTQRRTSSHPTRDDGFLLDTVKLGRRPGSMRTVERVVPAPERIGLDLVAIEKGSDIELDLRMEAVSEGVLVTGTLRADTAGECSRCLDPFTGTVDVRLTELFAYPDSVTDETSEEDEVHRVVDDEIDLKPIVIDAVGLELPLQPLCSEDCEGLCSECGIRLAIAESGHGHDILDPRWAGLAAKFGVESEPGKNLANNDLANNEAEEK